MQSKQRKPDRSKYTRVSTVEDMESEQRPKGERTGRRLGRKINNLVHSTFWVFLGIFIVIYSDFFRVVRIDKRIIRSLFYVSAFSWLMVSCIMGYLACYVPLWKKQRVDDYYVTHREHILAILLFGSVSMVTFTISVWPVWHWMSIIICVSLVMAQIMAANFVPNY